MIIKYHLVNTCFQYCYDSYNRHWRFSPMLKTKTDLDVCAAETKTEETSVKMKMKTNADSVCELMRRTLRGSSGGRSEGASGGQAQSKRRKFGRRNCSINFRTRFALLKGCCYTVQTKTAIQNSQKLLYEYKIL